MDGRWDGRASTSSRMNIKKITRQKITFIALGLIVVFQLTMALALKRVISGLAGRYSRELFCLFHECCVYFTSVRCRDWRTLISTEFQKRTIKFLLIRQRQGFIFSWQNTSLLC